MVRPPLEFYFDYSCPYAYLGASNVRALAAHMGRELRMMPMLLGGVFRANGTPQNLMNVLSPQKAAHNLADMQRWARLFEVPLSIPNTHPMRTVEALRATLLTECAPRVIQGFYRAYWVDHAPISEESVIRRVLTDAGIDPDPVMMEIGSERIKDDLRARTEHAIQLGIFGAPAYVVDGELYWGQDRANFVSKTPWTDLLPALGSDWLEPPSPAALGGDRGGKDAVSPPSMAPIPSPRAKDAPMTDRASRTPHTLEVYWDFSSPFAYLGMSQADELAKRTGAKLVHRPMLLGGLFKNIGQVDFPMSTFSDAKQRYYARDLQRWADYWNVPFRWPSSFPMNTVKALRCYLALESDAAKDAYRKRVFHAFWAEDRDIGHDDVLKELLGEGADRILEKTQDPAIKNELIERTKHAAEAGVFGAPTWVVDGKELFWGQDRIALVERALGQD